MVGVIRTTSMLTGFSANPLQQNESACFSRPAAARDGHCPRRCAASASEFHGPAAQDQADPALPPDEVLPSQAYLPRAKLTLVTTIVEHAERQMMMHQVRD